MSGMIQLTNVEKIFKQGAQAVLALRNISLEIAPAKITALMGPSGSGKSTLLNLIGAIDTASSGKVVVGTAHLETMNAEERADFRNQSVGFIFQNFNLIPVLTAFENVLLPQQLATKARQTDPKKRAAELLERVGLKEQRDMLVNRLSGGQMQRVAIARALMNKPTLILADEPTANLDFNTADQILKLLRDLVADEKVTAVIATHDPHVLEYATSIIKMKDGAVVSVDS